MPAKENTMKIKAKFDDTANSYNAGDVFEAKLLENSHYLFYDNDGDNRYRYKSEFDVVADEPAIEVGSVWVDKYGNELVIEYVGKQCAVCTWVASGKEFASPLKSHLKFYKPKPKTVTMYFYQYGDEYTAYSEPLAVKKSAFTREIELP